MLDYKLLEAFAAVVEEGGFEKGAKVLHLTQSAVSQRIKLLEEQAGCVLLVRATPPKPTQAGQKLLRHYLQVKRLEEDLGGVTQEGRASDSLTVGVNADSLATWFFPAIESYLDREPVVLDLSVDDQDQTHELLRNGEVLGCISTRPEAIQGCRVEFLGSMKYEMYCTKEYKSKWFPDGVTLETAEKAPTLIFNRKDMVHGNLLRAVFGQEPQRSNGFYLPDSEQFAPTIARGWVCGMLPDQQAKEYINNERIERLMPGHFLVVKLYWHCWNLASERLEGFTDALVRGARSLLDQES